MEEHARHAHFTSKWKEKCFSELTQLFDTLRNSKGRITLVVEPCLQPLLGMVVGPLFSLEAYGVDKMLLLQHPLAQISSHISTKNVVYLLRPEMGWVRVIAHHVSTENANHLVRTGLHIPSKAHRSAIFLSPSLEKVNDHVNDQARYHSLLFWPQRSVLCDRILEEEAALGLVDIYEYPIHLFPYSNGLLSMELQNSFKDLFLQEDTSQLYFIAKSLLSIEQIYGRIQNIKGRGAHAQRVADLLLQLKHQHIKSQGKEDIDMNDHDIEENGKIDTEKPSKASSSSIAVDNDKHTIDLFLIDRRIDLVTPMCTQLTYEGLIDEALGVKYGSISIESNLLEPQGAPHENGKEPHSQDNKEQMVTISLDSMGKDIYDEFRDVNFSGLWPLLNQRASQIDKDLSDTVWWFLELQKRKSISESEMQEAVPKIALLQQQKSAVRLHLNIAERLMPVTKGNGFRARLNFEQRLLVAGEAGVYLDDCIKRGVTMQKTLRLLSLLALTSPDRTNRSGTPSLRRYIQAIIDRYGLEHVCTLDNMKAVGLLENQEYPIAFEKLRRQLRLIIHDINENQPQDIAYVFSGYAPLSVRLVQSAVDDSWQQSGKLLPQLEDVLGPTFECSATGHSTDHSTPKPVPEGGGKRVVLVFFIGGVTHAEVAALRWLSNNSDVHYLVATTQLISGDSLIDSLIESPSALE